MRVIWKVIAICTKSNCHVQLIHCVSVQWLSFMYLLSLQVFIDCFIVLFVFIFENLKKLKCCCVGSEICNFISSRKKYLQINEVCGNVVINQVQWWWCAVSVQEERTSLMMKTAIVNDLVHLQIHETGLVYTNEICENFSFICSTITHEIATISTTKCLYEVLSECSRTRSNKFVLLI